ncbi:MAG TPA: tetratricopeptide repeat protein [Candidatus Eremiobacteraceae bacterium]|jgi:tetratricopeptide (TPR) repeat protein
MSDKDGTKDVRPYVIRTYDRWIILVIVLVGGWLLFRPIFAVVAAYRGVTYEAALFPDSAEHYYKKAIAIDPAVPDGWIHLGELYYFWSQSKQSRLQEAASTFEAGEKAVPGNATLPFDLGRIYLLKFHDYKNAEDALRVSVQRDPTKEFAWDYLAYAALKNGDRPYALECWRKVLQLNPNHDSARRALRQYGG